MNRHRPTDHARTAHRRPGRGPRPFVALLLGVGVLVVAFGALAVVRPPLAADARPADPTTPADDAATRPGAMGPVLQVEIVDVSPPFLTPDEPLTVTGTIRNSGPADLTAPIVDLRLQSNAPTSREVIDRWLDPAHAFATRPLSQAMLAASVPAGGQTSFALTVPAGEFPLSTTSSAWGPRGLEVVVSATIDGSTLEAAARTLMVWTPPSTAVPTALSVIVPLAPTAAEYTTAAEQGLGLASVSGDRIMTLATATSASAAVGWAVDPVVLSSAVLAPEAPSPEDIQSGVSISETLEDPATAGLANALRAGAVGREILPLPFADADLPAIAHAQRLDLLDATATTGADLFAAAGLTTAGGLAWPGADRPDAQTVETIAARGTTAAVMPVSALPPQPQLTYTATGRGTLETTSGPVAALLADDALSAALAGSATQAFTGELTGSAAALNERQYLLATTAMITRERPSDGRALLAAVPRSFDGDAAGLAERVAALQAAPWVTLAPLSALVATPAPEIGRAALPDRVTDSTEASRLLLDDVAEHRVELSAFAAIVPDPVSLVRTRDERLLQVTSTAWRAAPEARATYAANARGSVTELTAMVGVEDGGTVNLISSSGELPITVRNDLDQPVDAVLLLDPRGPALQIPDTSVPIVVEPRSELVVPVPVRALGSADVEIVASLVSLDGAPVGESTTLTVRVRAGWEGLGTAIVAALVGLAFVIGLVRSIRRGRRRADGVPPAAQAAREDAVS